MVAFVPATASEHLPAITPSPSRRRGACLRLGVGLLSAVLTLFQPAAADPGIVTREIAGAAFEDVAFALSDAIAAEGIGNISTSHFSDMLKRTAPDLGHPPELFADARIYTFCSARAAARLSIESPHHIALCPLSIAVYRIQADSKIIHLGYRHSAATSGGAEVDALLERIVQRTVDTLR